MNDKTKEIIIKTILVIESIAALFIFPGSFIYCWFLSENAGTILFMSSLTIAGVFGVLVMILLPIFGLKQKPVKAEKIPLSFDNYDSLAKCIADSAKINNYVQQPGLILCGYGTLVTYIKPNGLWKENCITLVRVAELKDEILDFANDAITESLKAYYGKEQITDTVDMVMIVCVDRITPTFQKFVNNNIQQGFKNGRLPVGISFGGKSIYIAKQKDGYAIAKYKKLRREFLKVMQIQT